MDLYDSKRKVVLVRGDKNKLYEQVIFILRAGVSQNQFDFVKEAEKIINASYTDANVSAIPMLLNQHDSGHKKAKNTSRIDIMLNTALFITGIAIVALFFLNFM